jgi:hypothetical protein
MTRRPGRPVLCATVVAAGLALSFTGPSQPAAAQGRAPASARARAAAPALVHDAAHDFDWEFGTWRTDLRRLKKPLSGSNEWVRYTGSTVVTKVWDGQANLVELDVEGPAGRLQALSLRLYNPQAKQWTLNFANRASGVLSLPPTTGEFKNGRGEFYSQETFGPRTILVRFTISDITATSAHFEQAFSDDGGKTWETNWIADDTRVGPPPPEALRRY